MSDYDRAPKATRGKVAQRAALKAAKAGGHAQTARTQEEQHAHRAAYKIAHMARTRQLEKDAKVALRAHLEAVQRAREPVTGSGPMGSFTLYEKLVVYFTGTSHLWLQTQMESRDAKSVNASALQRFTKQVKDAGFVSLLATRRKHEKPHTDFVALHAQLCCSVNRVATHEFIAAIGDEERLKFGQHPAVQALRKGSFLQILRAVNEVKRGRPPRFTVAPNVGSGIEVAMNWVDGGYSVESMVARSRFDTRRINVSQKETQADVLSGAALVFSGIPSLTGLRQFKPRNRPLQISHAGTARLHAEQLNKYHCEEAAKRVTSWFPQWDEGSKRGVTAVLVGGNGLLVDAAADSCFSEDDFYSDALGFEILSNKTGMGVASAVVSILERRGVSEFYFCGTDAVSSNVGHASGVIAYLRRRQKCILIFALRCGGHIDMRAWKHGLEKTGTPTTRSPIKRKVDEATIPAELLAIEDLYYLEKKWPALGGELQKRLPNGETNLKTSGCPDSRWTFWNELLRNKVGVTWIMGRLVRLWRGAVEAWLAESRSEPVDTSHVPLDEPLLDDRVPLRVVRAVVEADDFHCRLFDFTMDDDECISFGQLCDAYTGSWIRDDLDVATSYLGGEGVREALAPEGALHEEGATWDPPEGCPVSALTAETLPGLLLDIGSKHMRVRWAVWEAVGSGYMRPYLHRKEMRYPGIAFDAHEIIGEQREIGLLFGNEECPWRFDDVQALSERFAIALEAAFRYAQSMELEDCMVQFTDEYMSEHSEYYLEQTEEWWSNPAFRLAGVGSTVDDSTSEHHGTAHAAWLVEQGIPELRAALAEVLHVMPSEVRRLPQSPAHSTALQTRTNAAERDNCVCHAAGEGSPPGTRVRRPLARPRR